MTEQKRDTDPAPAPEPAELVQTNEHTTFAPRFSDRKFVNNITYVKVELAPDEVRTVLWSAYMVAPLRRLRARGGDYAGVEVQQMGVDPFKELEESVPLSRLVEPDHDNMQIVFKEGILRPGQRFSMVLRNRSDKPVTFWLRPIGFGDHLDGEEPWRSG